MISHSFVVAFTAFANLAAADLPTATFASNSPGASAYAFLPFAGSASEIKGRWDFQSQSNGSVEIAFSLSDIPSNVSYPLNYFLAQKGVPSNGDCYLTGPVLDPFGQLSICNPEYPQACKVGDLALKGNNNITNTSTGGDFKDNYISFNKSATSSFLNSSIVIMDANAQRIACTNITVVSAGNGTAGVATIPEPGPVTMNEVLGIPNNSSSTNSTSSSNGPSSATRSSGSSTGVQATTSSTSTSTSTSNANSISSCGYFLAAFSVLAYLSI